MILDQEELEAILFYELINKGYTPTEKEISDLSDITFSYIIDVFIVLGFDVSERLD